MFGDTPAGWPSVSAQVAGGSTSHRSLMVSEAAPGVPSHAWPPAITESVGFFAVQVRVGDDDGRIVFVPYI